MNDDGSELGRVMQQAREAAECPMLQAVYLPDVFLWYIAQPKRYPDIGWGVGWRSAAVGTEIAAWRQALSHFTTNPPSRTS